MKTIRLLVMLLLAFAGAVQAQVVTTTPTFFTAADPVTIIYDASQGNGGLNNFAGPVYIWTGVITNLSTSPSDWKYLKSANFNQADPAAQMTSLGNNRWSITLTPSVRAWYGVPTSEQILRLAMVFRNADGSRVGRSVSGGDIFIDVFQGGLGARITAPAGGPQYVVSGATVQVTGEASSAAQLGFRLNGAPVGTPQTGTTASTAITVTQTGRNVVRFTATSGTTSVSDSLILVVRPPVNIAPLPAGAKADGVTYLNGGTSVILSLSAPGKEFVYVLGEFNNWTPADAGFMNRTPGTDATTARWWVRVDNLVPGREYAYQYEVDGRLRIGDPYTEKVLDPNNDRFITAATYPNLKPYPTGATTGIVSVLQTNQTPYQWTTTGYQRPSKTDLVIYELHLRDFVQRHDFNTLRDTLNYLQRLGINAIELMPINEFEGNDSWGYNPSFYFAVDKYYGPKDDFKRLVDECHRRGMAVILDMVLNHSCGQAPMVQMYFEDDAPAANSPWYNRTATHPFNVCYDFNHESPFTKYFSKRVMEFWMQEFRIDGYRFDLSKGFTQRNTGSNVGLWGQYDQSRIDIWLDYQAHMRSVDPNVFIILEHFADNSEETVLANAGMMLWGNHHSNFSQAAQARIGGSNFSGISYRQRGWQQPNLVGYAESHDEERIMVDTKQSGLANTTTGYNTRSHNTALERMALNATFLLGVPGPKMVWQFGELGYDVSINFNGRTGAKPIRWNYQDSLRRRIVYNTYAAMAALKKSEPALEATTWTHQLSGQMKGIQLSDGAGSDVIILGNFGLNDNLIDPFFPRTGKWYNYLRGDSITVTDVTAPLSLRAGEYVVYTSRRLRRPAGVITNTRTTRAADLQLSVTPNPASRQATVRLALAQAAPVRVTLTNVLGQQLRTVALPGRQAAGKVEVPLPLQRLSPGVYLVRVEAGAGTEVQRLVVQP